MATMFGGEFQAAAARVGRRLLPRRRREDRSQAAPASPLNALVQAEIIPRLLVAHRRPAPPTEMVGSSTAIEAADADRFAPLALTLEADELLEEVERFLARGVPVEAILVDLLAPSARRLGQFWEEDDCDFVDVTMGLWRLQEVMREIAARMPGVRQVLAAPRSALFSPMPGEQHSFGTLMVEEVFARAGWETEVLIEPKRQELLRVLATRNFDLAGLTVSCDSPSGPLSELITAMRSVSKNPVIQILIGGRVVNADPELAARAGADGTAQDARSALALAEAKVPQSRPLDCTV